MSAISVNDARKLTSIKWMNTISPPELQTSNNLESTGPIATIIEKFDSAYGIWSAASKVVTLDNYCDLQRPRGHFSLLQPSYNLHNTIPPPGLQPSYNSESNVQIRKIYTPIDSVDTILSAASKMATVDDLSDLERSQGQLCLLRHPITHDLLTTGPIATVSTSFISNRYI